SEFVVRLPALPAALEGRETADGAPPRPGGCPPRRVLVVDDHWDGAESTAALLRIQGHEVRTAHDGPEALEAARAFRPQVVLLDIGLPGMDGYEVARRLRQEPESGGVVLVAVTGYGRDEDRRAAAAAGFDHHLV